MLTRTIGPYLSWPVDRFASLLAPTRIPPNVITWSALVLNLWAGVLFAAGRFAAAAGMMMLAGLCDLLDGPVARLQDRVSKFGGFLDSILDRYSDLIIFLGILVYYVHIDRFPFVGLAGTAMAGSVQISYAKARAESLVPPSEVGFWDRPERLVLIMLGAFLNRIPLVLGILAIGTNITVIHRIYHTWKQTEGQAQNVHEPGATALESARPPMADSLAREKPKTHPILTRSARRGG
jgi:CDP-diacylglycerol---glycerol-3-phosphate 3-phosphatidyltransferase